MNNSPTRSFPTRETLEDAMLTSLECAAKNLCEATDETRQLAKLKYSNMLHQFTRLVVYREVPDGIACETRNGTETSRRPDAVRHRAVLADFDSEGELTHRETQVLRLICDEYTSRQIALELGISFRTAVCHRANIMSKLGVRNTAGMVRYAIRYGIIDA
jgi:DNA-binding NarL/FixJ family response regulator